jgi:hypothetical protein
LVIFVTDYRESWDIRSKNGSLCFASAIYARLVGGEQDESELLWLAEYLRVNSTALAQPEPEGPTDEELLRTYGKAKREHCYDGPIDDWPRREERAATVHGLRAVLARYARPTIKPVPVAERPWEREGWCDAEGRCWWGRVEGNPGNPEWFLAGLSEIEGFYEIGDWIVLLPHHALPLPQP